MQLPFAGFGSELNREMTGVYVLRRRQIGRQPDIKTGKTILLIGAVIRLYLPSLVFSRLLWTVMKSSQMVLVWRDGTREDNIQSDLRKSGGKENVLCFSFAPKPRKPPEILGSFIAGRVRVPNFLKTTELCGVDT